MTSSTFDLWFFPIPSFFGSQLHFAAKPSPNKRFTQLYNLHSLWSTIFFDNFKKKVLNSSVKIITDSWQSHTVVKRVSLNSTAENLRQTVLILDGVDIKVMLQKLASSVFNLFFFPFMYNFCLLFYSSPPFWFPFAISFSICTLVPCK